MFRLRSLSSHLFFFNLLSILSSCSSPHNLNLEVFGVARPPDEMLIIGTPVPHVPCAPAHLAHAPLAASRECEGQVDFLFVIDQSVYPTALPKTLLSCGAF